MSSKNVLVVDDEQDIRELLQYNLEKEGYQVHTVATGEGALMHLKDKQPDLILLDLMLPGLDGLEVCKQVKGGSSTRRIPVLMLTAKGEEEDVIAGLEMGADDYVVKPFSPKVLLARMRALVRRASSGSDDQNKSMIERGPLAIDLERHELRVDDAPVKLTALEMRILATLAARPGRVFTRYQIVEATQGVGVGVTDRSVDVHIVSLRRKLGEHAALIETVRGVGYRFSDVEDEE